MACVYFSVMETAGAILLSVILKPTFKYLQIQRAAGSCMVCVQSQGVNSDLSENLFKMKEFQLVKLGLFNSVGTLS